MKIVVEVKNILKISFYFLGKVYLWEKINGNVCNKLKNLGVLLYVDKILLFLEVG